MLCDGQTCMNECYHSAEGCFLTQRRQNSAALTDYRFELMSVSILLYFEGFNYFMRNIYYFLRAPISGLADIAT